MMGRYERYKPSALEWIGEIPEHWELLRLKYLALVQPSNVDKKTIENEASVLLCNYMDVYKNEFIDESINFMEATATDSEIEKFKIKNGDVLVTKDSETPDDIANPAFVKSYFENVICAYHLTQIRPNREKLLGEYLFRLFQEHRYKGQFEVNANGVTRFGLSVSAFSDVFVPLPSPEEQNAIANFLDEKTTQIDKLIANKQKLIELLKEERTVIVNNAVTKGINSHVKLRPSGIEWLGEIPKHWELKKLKYVAKINPSKPSYEFEKSSEDEIVFLPMEKVSENGDINQELRRKIIDVSSGFTYFERDDVIVAKITPCFENMKGALLDSLKTDFGFGSTEFHTLRADESVLPKFIFFITRTERFLTIGEAFMTGSAGQKRVPTSFVENFLVGIPPKEEQKQIIQRIETENRKIDNTISKIQKEILLQEYRTALISEVVTGKVKVI